MLYRIFTENINRSKIESLCTKEFSGFTLIPATGYWKSVQENSLIIEIVAEKQDKKIRKLARKIRDSNNQEAVLVQEIINNQYLI